MLGDLSPGRRDPGLTPIFVAAYHARAFVYAAKGDYGNAIADYTEAIRLNPKVPPSRTRTAATLTGTGANTKELLPITQRPLTRPKYANAYCGAAQLTPIRAIMAAPLRTFPKRSASTRNN